MGSKWDFLSPHWRVLFGWEKGWFIYTPVTMLMVLGFFFIKKNDSSRAILVYFFLNLWIIIAWHDWRYGGSYSTRALTQCLAVLAIPLGSLIEKSINTKWRLALMLISFYLITVNLFQIWQYNKTIIHYDDMNRRYYAAVYLNPDPNAIDMSLLDTNERPWNEKNLHPGIRISSDTIYALNGNPDSVRCVLNKKLASVIQKESNCKWLKISARVKSTWGAFGATTEAELYDNNLIVKKRAIRMQNGICKTGNWNLIEFYFQLPPHSENLSLRVCFKSKALQQIEVKDFQIIAYSMN